MRRRKRKVLVPVLACLIAVFVSTTAAFILHETDTESVITFGSLALKPHLYTVSDGEKNEVDSSEVVPISNLDDLSRILNIENVGSHPMYVRVNFDTFLANDSSEKIDDIIYVNEKDGWTYQDRYYYYNDVLNPGETTTDLMDKLLFDNHKVISDYKGEKINFKINIEAVQSEHNENNAMGAHGWPE